MPSRLGSVLRKTFRSRIWLATILGVVFGTSPAFGQRNLTDIPDPDPSHELESFIVADGFEVNLFASDPMLAKPIQINFDDQGRLWVASSEVYPHIEPGQVANDKVLILEDQNGDGVADQTHVFADGLLIPTGILPGDDGCYVVNSTELLHLRDTDGDNAADARRIVLSGFGTEDTHHLLHTLRWGPDGRLYMNQSIYIHSHIETPYGVRHLNGGGIWRYDPWTQELDVLCRGFVNPWGHHFDQWGQSFATDGAYGEGINYVFPGAVFVTAVGATRTVRGLNPGSPKHCGLEIVGGSHLPDDWQGNMLTNDFRANRVCRFVVSENGSGYASQQMTEVIKSSNVAFRPIDVKVGPDGAIYIADWYNPIIQHGEVDFRDPRRDHTHGRIWRVTAKGRDLSQWPQIADATIEELLALLLSPEPPVRLHAKLNLKSFPPSEVATAIEEWTRQWDPQQPEHAQPLLEALWAYQNIHQPNVELLEQLLASPVAQVRAAAVRTLIDWKDDVAAPLNHLAKAVRDDHPRVRLEAVRGLSTIRHPSSISIAMQALENPMDSFLDFALWQTAKDLEPVWLPALQSDSTLFGSDTDHALFALEAVDSPATVGPILSMIRNNDADQMTLSRGLKLLAKHGRPDDLRVVFENALEDIQTNKLDQGVALLEALQQSCRERDGLAPSGNLDSLVELGSHPSAAVRSVVCRAIGTWKLQDGLTFLSNVAHADDTEWPTRVSAINAFADFSREVANPELSKLAKSSTSAKVRRHAIATMVRTDLATACELAIGELSRDDDPQGQEQVWRSILTQQGGIDELKPLISDQNLSDTSAKILLRTAQSLSLDDSFLKDIRQAGALDDATWTLSAELTKHLIEQVETSGDPEHGEAIYRMRTLQCQTCHAIAGAGGAVGPDLASIGASAPVDYLIESLLSPNAKIKENFHTKTLITADGRVVNGIPVSQSGGVLTMRLADGARFTIRESEVEEIADGKSLMAEGLVDPLTEDELVDLVTFLSQLGRVGRYSVDNRLMVRQWQSLVWTEAAHRRLNRSSFDSVANSNDKTFTWRPEYSRVSGELPLDELAQFKPHENLNSTAFVRFKIQVDQPGLVTFALNQTEGLQSWHGDSAVPINELESMRLARGTHEFTFAIDRQLADRETFAVELLPDRATGIQLQLNVADAPNE